jgi:hypothetical protein
MNGFSKDGREACARKAGRFLAHARQHLADKSKESARWSMEDERQSDSCNMLIMTARKQEETYYA